MRPDFIGVYREPSSTSGLVVDIKWSLPDNHQALVAELTGVTKYAGPLYEWPTKTSVIDSVDLVILCHGDHAVKTREALTGLYTDDSEAYGYVSKPGYSVWSWGEVKNSDGVEVIRIFKTWGETTHSGIEVALTGNIDLPKVQFLVEHSEVRFVGDEPPLAYVIIMVMQGVRSYVFGLSRDRVRVISIEDLYRIFNNAFPPLNETSGSQISKSRLRLAVDVLVEIGYNARKLSDPDIIHLGLDPGQDWYEFVAKLPKTDLYEWICRELNRLASRRAREKRKKTHAAKPVRLRKKRKFKLSERQTKLQP